jgi:hypothetical protein
VGTLLSGKDRGSAIERLKAQGHSVPAARSMSASWLRRVISEAVPTACAIRGHELPRYDLDRATKLVGENPETPGDRTLLRG